MSEFQTTEKEGVESFIRIQVRIRNRRTNNINFRKAITMIAKLAMFYNRIIVQSFSVFFILHSLLIASLTLHSGLYIFALRIVPNYLDPKHLLRVLSMCWCLFTTFSFAPFLNHFFFHFDAVLRILWQGYLKGKILSISSSYAQEFVCEIIQEMPFIQRRKLFY